MKSVNILIRGGGWVNKGAEAMLCTTQQQLTSKLPGSRFFAGLPPAPDTYGASECFSTLPELQGSLISRVLQLGKALLRCPRLLIPLFTDRWATMQAIAGLEKVDVVLDISGFAYSDEWGTSWAARTWTYSLYARCLGKPYVFLPQAWGPFENQTVARFTRDLINWSPLVCVRDQKSLSYVEALLGRGSDQVRLTPDIAFRFKFAPSADGESLIRSLGIGGKGEPLLGIAPNMRVFERMPGSGQDNHYVQLMAKVVRWAWHAGASVVLIPHEISFAKDPQDDRFLCRLIKDAVGDGGVVTVLDGLHSAADVKAVIGNLDMLVGSRFHSIVAALSCSVPPVVLGWSHKYLELMRSVGLEDLVLDYGQPETAALIERIDAAWTRRRELRDQLNERVPEIEAGVDRVFNLVADLIRGAY